MHNRLLAKHSGLDEGGEACKYLGQSRMVELMGIPIFDTTNRTIRANNVVDCERVDSRWQRIHQALSIKAQAIVEGDSAVVDARISLMVSRNVSEAQAAPSVIAMAIPEVQAMNASDDNAEAAFSPGEKSAEIGGRELTQVVDEESISRCTRSSDSDTSSKSDTPLDSDRSLDFDANREIITRSRRKRFLSSSEDDIVDRSRRRRRTSRNG